ncbi:hypothetical protein AAFF_G00105770 [Aldrovandia affinis]|uniref:AIG1-type G domain-containing protein n=1 Tax=Aldrovandia affinis TaxID=143900 RepID=A0AAD7WXU0_9TELE|nr:hypothetical protein AAFF_G00105770 [Aldrovandia affinis]
MSVINVISSEELEREVGRDTVVTIDSPAPYGQDIALSDVSGLRMILLGERESGRSAVGNAIMGRRVFDAVGVRTRQSVKRQGVVAGRRITVVDTPGWEWFPSRQASWGVKREISHSVSLCPPGPHALLLVVPLSFTFGEREMRKAEEHLELFGGERAWRHTLVLFTAMPGRLRDSTIEEEIEESEALPGLVERCGNRFHVIPARTRKGKQIIAELLGKVEDMVAGNQGEVISSEEVLEEATEREKEQVRRDEEMEEREKELARVKKALRVLEQEEETEEVGREEEDEESAVPRMKNVARNERVSTYGSENRQEEPPLTSDHGIFGLRASFRKS